MTGINKNIDKKQIRIAVLTVSDTRDLETDSSGATLAARIGEAGHVLHARALLRDEVSLVREQVTAWVADAAIDVIITTGGTGLTGRDVTIEALSPLFDKIIDGFSIIFHQVSYQSVGLSTLQSRAMAGLIGTTIVFCLPGSTGAVKDGWDEIIQYELDSRYKPCNLVEIMPRLDETDT